MKQLWREAKQLVLDFFENTFRATSRERVESEQIFAEVKSQRVHDNLVRILPSAVLLLLIEVSGRFSAIVRGLTLQPIVSKSYTIALIVFCAVSLVFFFVANKQLEDPLTTDFAKTVTITLFWLCYFANALVFSCMEMYDQGTIDNYMIFIAVFTFIPMLSPWVSAAFYIMSLLIETVVTFQYGNTANPQERVITCLGITALGMVVSTMLYSSFISDSISKKKFERLSETDPMTLMLNRRGMQKHTDLLWATCKRHDINICVIMCDIDFFKGYNDTFGHAMGDECIKSVANCIKTSFTRKSDATARYGGEEFLIVASGVTGEEMVKHVMKMQDKVRELKMEAGNKTVSDVVTISAGMFEGTAKYFDNIQQFIEKADEQLYNVKEHGRNGLSFNGDIYRTEAALKAQTKQ